MKNSEVIEYGIRNSLINPNKLIGLFVENKKNGKGIIKNIEGKNVYIDFKKGGIKKFSIEFINLLSIEDTITIDVCEIKKRLYKERKVDEYLEKKYKVLDIDDNLFSILYRIEENDYSKSLNELFSLINEPMWEKINQLDREFLDEKELRSRELFQVLAIKYEEKYKYGEKIDYWLLINASLYWKKYKTYIHALRNIKKAEKILDEREMENEKYMKEKSNLSIIAAEILCQTKELRQARIYGKKAIDNNPEDFHAHMIYAEICRDLKSKAEAEKHFNIAKELKANLNNENKPETPTVSL